MNGIKKKILVVEDELSLLKAVEESLSAAGYEVALARDAEEGMLKLEDFSPDLVLLDLILPGKNGFEFLKELKDNPRYTKIPVVIFSNLGDEQEVRQGLNLGAADYLLKADYDMSEIIHIIEKNLKKDNNSKNHNGRV